MIRRLTILLLIVGCEEEVLDIIEPDVTSPIVVITFPANNSTLDSTTTVRADVTDDSDIDFVKFIIDGRSDAVADSTAPYEYEWDVCVQSTGTHTLMAKASDSSGNEGQSDLLTYTINASYDCENVCGGDKLLDNCGTCGGNNSTCSGCIDIYALNYDNSAIINADCNYADHTIDITDDGVSPFILEISTGESVQWNNKTSQHVGINGDIAEINYDLNSDGFIDIFIGEPINTGDYTFYLSEKGQGVIGSLLFDSAWWYSYDCIQESCVIDNAETIVEDCIEYQNTSLDELSIICMPLIVVITND